jgi:hypothetical protein
MMPMLHGCRHKESDFKPISDGFGVVGKWIGIDSGPSAALYYRTNGSKPVLIWPFLTGEMCYTNDLFFFVGSIRDKDGTITIDRYFAVKAPGPALDVSDDLLKCFADAHGWEFKDVKKVYGPLQLIRQANGIEVHFLGPYQQPNTLLVNWEQVSNIIHQVKQTGKQHAVDNPHVIYLKNDY